jgi:hypothetical protein
MNTAPLFITDVMALPRENSLAIFALDVRSYAALAQSSRDRLANDVELELTKLPIAIRTGGQNDHTLKCAVLMGKTIDSNCAGGTQVLLCRAVGVNISDELLHLAGSSQPSLHVQLGGEVARVSAETLSASADAAKWITRRYLRPTGSPAKDKLQASVVIPIYDKEPPYLLETMRYFEEAGISHVYLGLVGQYKRGSTREQLQPFLSKGFVSILETEDWGGFHWNTSWEPYHQPGPKWTKVDIPTIEVWKTIINDWALYHAKSFDDLLLIHDYDELVVPTSRETIPSAVQRLLETNKTELRDLCSFLICPVIAYGSEIRNEKSRAEDFAWADGGQPSFKSKSDATDSTNPLQFCEEGGYTNLYPKSIAVVQTIYKTSVHVPGSCSAGQVDVLVGESVGHHRNVHRDEGLIVQHLADMRYPGRFRPPADHVTRPSSFAEVWGSRVRTPQPTSPPTTPPTPQPSPPMSESLSSDADEVIEDVSGGSSDADAESKTLEQAEQSDAAQLEEEPGERGDLTEDDERLELLKVDDLEVVPDELEPQDQVESVEQVEPTQLRNGATTEDDDQLELSKVEYLEEAPDELEPQDVAQNPE